MFNPAGHPHVLSGKYTEEEILQQFLDSFEFYFNLCVNNTNNNYNINIFLYCIIFKKINMYIGILRLIVKLNYFCV